MTSYLLSLLGGMLIGLSAVMLMMLNGRVAGISGIVGSLVQGTNWATNVAFVLGLMLGPVAYLSLLGRWPEITITEPLAVIIAAGLLVGFGTRMGSGCTSGHGVVGLARLSPRSFVATLSFVGAGMVTVFVLRNIGL